MKVLAFGDVRAGARGEPRTVGNLRQQRILVALLLAGPRGLSVDQLAARVWDPDEEPASPVPTLRTYVRRLRAVAGDATGQLVRTRPGGYELAVAPDDTDVGRFDSLAAAALRALDPDEAVALAGEAVALWRGPPFPGLEDLDWVEPEAARLGELLLSVQELGLEARLDLGAGGVAAEAGVLLADHPYRERLRTLRALALYRAGRQADALADIAEHRQRLAEDLGVDVSTEVRDLELAILRQDPSAGRPARRRSTTPGVPDRPPTRDRCPFRRLPRRPAVGRARRRRQGHPRRAGGRPVVRPAVRRRGPDGGPAVAPARRAAPRLLARGRAGVPRHAARGRWQPRGCGPARPAGASAGGEVGRRGSRRARLRPSPGGRPPRRQTVQHPARPRGQRLPRRLRDRTPRRSRSRGARPPVRGFTHVRGPGAVRRRPGRPRCRRVRPRGRALRRPHRSSPVAGRDGHPDPLQVPPHASPPLRRDRRRPPSTRPSTASSRAPRPRTRPAATRRRAPWPPTSPRSPRRRRCRAARTWSTPTVASPPSPSRTPTGSSGGTASSRPSSSGWGVNPECSSSGRQGAASRPSWPRASSPGCEPPSSRPW